MFRIFIIMFLLGLTINVIDSKPKFVPRKHISNKARSVIRLHHLSKKIIKPKIVIQEN